VLVVDDDPMLRGAVSALLHERGFEVVGEADDGPTAVALAKERRPDVVLIDFRMSGMDGLEATRLIHAEAPFVQAVLYTAYDDQTLNVEAARGGIYCLLVKGCSPQFMLDILRQAAIRKWELETGPPQAELGFGPL
jgi:DNA-binding NarL/FixJ family response regulator